MVSSLERVLAESPFGAVFVVLWAGVLASLSSCLLVRVPVIFGLVVSKRKPFFSLSKGLYI
jgi:cytochrome c biogenesis protein CcdA